MDKLRGVRDIDLEDNKQLEKILIQSIRCRKVGKTWANNISSRSHMIIDLMITKPGENKMHGKLCLIDLAGNERCCDSTYFGELTKREMSDINTSLMYLNECIRKMAVSTSCNRQKMKTNHISFRGCLLTRIHRDSFMRDNTRIAMIATVSPGYKHEHAIVNTLLYAQQLSTVNANVISESIQSASSISRARINSEMTKGKIFKFKKKYRNLVGNKLIQGDHARKLIRSNNQLYRAIAGNEDNGSDITLSSESTGSDNFSGCCRKLKKTITTIENIKSNSGEQGHKETIKSINTLLDTCQKQLYQIKEKVKTNFN
ncbi:hypothetical protein GJ496_008820 [Pomphorhynchus laevis]|nr:hypothetical protein GJ496_008820 [Pomphorhynchus laevis]